LLNTQVARVKLTKLEAEITDVHLDEFFRIDSDFALSRLSNEY